jgi:antitoxin Phd
VLAWSGKKLAVIDLVDRGRTDEPKAGTHATASEYHRHHRGWKLEDAKARFSELVRRAQSEGPQHLTVRGRDAVMVIRAAELERLLPEEWRFPSVEFMESLYVEGLDLRRSPITVEMSSRDRLASGHGRCPYDHQPGRCADCKGLGGGAGRRQVFPDHLDLGRVRQWDL